MGRTYKVWVRTCRQREDGKEKKVTEGEEEVSRDISRRRRRVAEIVVIAENKVQWRNIVKREEQTGGCDPTWQDQGGKYEENEEVVEEATKTMTKKNMKKKKIRTKKKRRRRR